MSEEKRDRPQEEGAHATRDDEVVRLRLGDAILEGRRVDAGIPPIFRVDRIRPLVLRKDWIDAEKERVANELAEQNGLQGPEGMSLENAHATLSRDFASFGYAPFQATPEEPPRKASPLDPAQLKERWDHMDAACDSYEEARNSREKLVGPAVAAADEATRAIRKVWEHVGQFRRVPGMLPEEDRDPTVVFPREGKEIRRAARKLLEVAELLDPQEEQALQQQASVNRCKENARRKRTVTANARDAAARAMNTLAKMLRSLPLTDEDPTMIFRESGAQIRYDAEVLRKFADLIDPVDGKGA